MKRSRVNTKTPVQCKICGMNFSSYAKLSMHIQKIHKMSTREYFDNYVEPNNDHKCMFCDNKCSYKNMHVGYTKTCGSPECTDKLTKANKLVKYGDPNYSNRAKAAQSMKNRSFEQKEQSRLKKAETKKRLLEEDPEYENKIKDKANKTRRSKYNGRFESLESVEKRKQTNIERYGVENVFSSEVIKEQIRQTNLTKRNTEYPMQLDECKKKALDTFNEHKKDPKFLEERNRKNREIRKLRYGDENYRNGEKQKQTNANKSEQEKLAIVLKRQKTCMEKYGVKNYVEIAPRAAGISKLSLRVKEILEKHQFPYEIEFRIHRDDIPDKFRSYDFKFNNVILELNGDYFHANPKVYSENDIIVIRHEPIKVKDIWDGDNEKRLLAERHGFKVVYLWECDMKKITDCQLFEWILENCQN